MKIIDKKEIEDYKSLLEKYKREDFVSERNENEISIEQEIAEELKDNRLARDIAIKHDNIKKLSKLDSHNADYNNYLRRAKKALQDIIIIAEKD